MDKTESASGDWQRNLPDKWWDWPGEDLGTWPYETFTTIEDLCKKLADWDAVDGFESMPNL